MASLRAFEGSIHALRDTVREELETQTDSVGLEDDVRGGKTGFRRLLANAGSQQRGRE